MCRVGNGSRNFFLSFSAESIPPCIEGEWDLNAAFTNSYTMTYITYSAFMFEDKSDCILSQAHMCLPFISHTRNDWKIKIWSDEIRKVDFWLQMSFPNVSGTQFVISWSKQPSHASPSLQNNLSLLYAHVNACSRKTQTRSKLLSQEAPTREVGDLFSPKWCQIPRPAGPVSGRRTASVTLLFFPLC